MQLGIFWGRTGFLEYGHLDKHFMHDIQKKGFAGRNFLVFLQNILKTAFKIRIYPIDANKQGNIFQN